MASLPTRTTASFDAIKPVSSLVLLDNEFNQLEGAAGIFNGGTTAFKLKIKTSDGADPVIELDQVGAGPILLLKQNGVAKVTFNNNGTVTFVNTAVNTGLNADQVDGIEGSNIAKLDTNKTAFSVAFFEADPSTGTLSVEDRPSWVCPDGNAVTITKLWARWISGSHTSGGSVTFTFRKRTGAGALSGDIGNITLDNTNNTQYVTYKNDIADVPLNPDDSLTYYISARSGTVSERNVAVGVYGKQLFTT